MSSKSLRSLMKDRQLAKRIQHQFAKYDTMGRLTCTICNGLTVKSEALWPSHLTSKPHRLNYQSHQNQLNSHLEKNGTSTATLAKRKTDEMSADDRTDGTTFQEKKVRFDSPSSQEDKGESSIAHPLSKPSLPSDFFDDPSQAPTKVSNQAEEEHQEEEDPEWKAFEAALQQEAVAESNPANLFAQASVIAEPVLYESGNPSETVRSQNLELVDDEMLQEEPEQEEDPIEKKIREEKEEIMDRIQNEEREQLEADQRVLRMKARINAFRASRKKIPKNITT